MKNRVTYIIILFMTLISVVQSMAQSSQPDVVCMGTSRNYYVTATSGSTYIWKINEGSPEASTINSVDINWTTPGIYTLAVQEKTQNNCVGPVQSLHVTVIALPTATISGTTTICQNGVSPVVTFTGAVGIAPYTFTYNINGGTSTTLTTTTGDIVTMSVPTTVSGTFAYNLVDVTDSRSYTHAQTGTATITIKVPSSSTQEKTICSKDLPYNWNGLTFVATGTQTTTLINSAGCDSIATLNLTVNEPSKSTTKTTTCPYALPYLWNGISCNAAGTYTASLMNSSGCDSIATLILNVKSPLTSTTLYYICSSELPYYWNKNLYYKAGTYNAPFNTTSGCDSIATLILTVVYPTGSTTRHEVSSTQLPYVWNKMDFTESGTYTSPNHYVNSAGCDSIAKLILKVNLSTSAITNASICASDLPYIWNGTPYYSPSTYTKMMTNVFGAEVVVTLNLTVIAASNTSQAVTLFSGDTYTINGHVYDREGTYTDILKTVNGCDSLLSTYISIIDVPNTITPNGNGHSNIFMPGSRVLIYNRNGILLHKGENGWDCKYHDKTVSQDTYFYVLYYTSEGKTKTKEGYLMVVPL